MPRGGECGPLRRCKCDRLTGAEPKLQREWVVHQRHQAMRARQALRSFGHHAHGQSVDHDRPVGRDGKQHFRRFAHGLVGWKRVTVSRVDDVNLPALRAQSGDDLAIVAVPPGHCGKIARDDKREASHHSGA